MASTSGPLPVPTSLIAPSSCSRPAPPAHTPARPPAPPAPRCQSHPPTPVAAAAAGPARPAAPAPAAARRGAAQHGTAPPPFRRPPARPLRGGGAAAGRNQEVNGGGGRQRVHGSALPRPAKGSPAHGRAPASGPVRLQTACADYALTARACGCLAKNAGFVRKSPRLFCFDMGTNGSASAGTSEAQAG